jgi:adenylate cyclase
MSEVHLHETDAAVVTIDLRSFSAVCEKLALLDLGVALTRFYEHAERCVAASGGRLVKLIGDSVLAAWLGGEVARPRDAALEAVARAIAERASFVAENQAAGLPELDYIVTAAAGRVLAGQIGARALSAFDVVGTPVNVAFKLSGVATQRGVDHLLAYATPATTPVEGIDLWGRRFPIYRLKA